MLSDKAKKVLMGQDRYIDMMEAQGKHPTLYLTRPQYAFVMDAIKSSAKVHKIRGFDPKAFKYRGCELATTGQ
jgi:hypothetical protein